MKAKWPWAILILLLSAHALWYYQAIGWNAVDDAYISFVYARNAILGYGLTFNPSERVEGFTNFLWTAMMTPIVGAGLDVGRVSSALGVAFAALTLVLVIRFPRLLGVATPIGWLAALWLVADGSFALWSVSGLETALFTFLLTYGAWLYLGASEQSTVLKSGIVFALAAMTRPEAVAVFALTVGHQAVWRILNQRKLVERADLVRSGAFCALFVPYWLLRWRYYHSFFPNSFYAKVTLGGPMAQLERGWSHLQQFVGVHLGWLVLLPALLALFVALVQYATADRRPPTADRRSPTAVYILAFPSRAIAAQRVFGFTYFAVLIVAYSAYIVYVGGDWSVGRFFVPILPAFYLLSAAGLFEMARLVLHHSHLVTRAALFAGIGFAGVLGWTSSYNGEYTIFVRGFDAARATEARITAGRWLNAHVPRGTWIAVDAAGQVPYWSELPAIDMFGINDLHIGRLPVATLGKGTPGHEKFDLAYILARAPRYVIIYGTLFDAVPEYRRLTVKWTDNPELEKFLTIYERVAGR